MRKWTILLSLALAFSLTACGAEQPDAASPPPSGIETAEPSPEATPDTAPDVESGEEKVPGTQLTMTVGDTVLTISLLDSEAARELADMLPMTVTLSDYAGREKFTKLSAPLASAQATETGYEVGDLCYWAPGNSIVVFYRQDGERIDGLQKLGAVDSGIELLESYEDSMEVTIDLATGGDQNSGSLSEEDGQDMNMEDKVRLSFDGGEMIVRLNGNSAARSLTELLPLTLTFQDFAGEEKISYLPDELDLSDVPDGCDPSVGDLTLYAPWGNLAFFYEDHGYSDGLIPLGTIESGADLLERLDTAASVTVEIADE